MSYRLGRLAAILVVLLALVSACGEAGETPQEAATATVAVAPTTFESPLPDPTATQSAFDSPLPTPTRGPSSKDRAAVVGTLTLLNPESIAPQEDGLYLVAVDTESAMVLPAIDPETSIQADVDEVTGQFFFDDVDVGLYAFAVLTIGGGQLSVREMATGVSSIVSVTEQDLGTVIELGELRLP